MDTLPKHITPEPSGKIRDGAARAVTALGGRVYHKAVHADRVLVPDPEEGGPDRVELAECGHRGTLVDLPDPDTNNPVRLCIVCDSLPRVPRVLAAARRYSA